MKEIAKLGLGKVFCVLIILAMMLVVSGCTDAVKSQEGVPGATLIGHDETTVSGIDSETGKTMSVKVVVDVYSDKDLTVVSDLRYKAIGEKMTDFAAITHRGIAFAFGVKNTGKADILIAGAKIKDNYNEQEYKGASESDHPIEPKTVKPGETIGVFWTFFSQIEGDTNYVVEIKTLKSGGNVAKAQVAQPSEVETVDSSEIYPTPTPTQVGESYYKAVLRKDAEEAEGYLIASHITEDVQVYILEYAQQLISHNVAEIKIENMEYGKSGNDAFGDMVYLDSNGKELNREKRGFYYRDGKWKVGSIY